MIGLRVKSVSKDVDTNQTMVTIEILKCVGPMHEYEKFGEVTIGAKCSEPEIMDNVFVIQDSHDAVLAQAEVATKGLNIPGIGKGTPGKSILDDMDERKLAAMFSDTGPDNSLGAQEFKPEDASIDAIAEEMVKQELARMKPQEPIKKESEPVVEVFKAIAVTYEPVPLEECPVECQ